VSEAKRANEHPVLFGLGAAALPVATYALTPADPRTGSELGKYTAGTVVASAGIVLGGLAAILGRSELGRDVALGSGVGLATLLLHARFRASQSRTAGDPAPFAPNPDSLADPSTLYAYGKRVL